MAVGDYPIAPFTSPVGTDRAAFETRGNDNVLRDKFVGHQADAVAHPTSGTLAARPASASEGAIYFATDTGDIYIWTSGAWALSGGQVAGSGTTGKIPKWTDAQTLGDSVMTESAGVIKFPGNIEVTGDVETDGWLKFGVASTEVALYKSASDIMFLRGYNDNGGDTRYSVLALWPFQTTWGTGNREATLALYRADNNETSAEFVDIYNNGYSSETQFGIRCQKRGTGVYRDFVVDYYDGTTKTEVSRIDGPTQRTIYAKPITTATPSTADAPVRIPHGSAPTSPTNGDLWTTTSGMEVRVNGATQYASWTEQAAVADATGGTVIDSEARAALNSLLAKLRTINIIAP